MISDFTRRMLDWYAQNARKLPWRDHPDPYAVWVSEIMLQQTRVDTVMPYFQRWMVRFPSIKALAEASEQDVLQTWEGLGYYSRARNLHKAAQLVMARHGGALPDELSALQKLPGIGRYTAGAIASMAFGRDTLALDGNLRRVIARVFDMGLPARSPQGEQRLEELLAIHLPPGRAGDYNQALMDLGATICTPRDPNCAACPLAEICKAFALGIQEQRPVLERRPPVPHYIVTAAVIRQDGKVLISRRPENGLLGGLWEFPGGKQEPGEELPDCLAREIDEELGVQIQVGPGLGIYRHAYTHFKVTLHAFECSLVSGEPRAIQVADWRWVSLGELRDYPMGKIDRQISLRLVSE